MNKRIKEVRKELGLNQTEFGEKISVRQTTIAGYENGTRTPMDAVITAICKTFNVSESWLRTGKGEMFVQTSTFTLDDYAKSNGLSRFEEKIIKDYMELPKDVHCMIVDQFKKAISDDDDIDREVEDYRHEL